MEQLSPYATNIEPVLWSPGTIITEPTNCNYWNLRAPEPVLHSKRSPNNEKPINRN